jgi:hypothetical protein
MKSALIYILVSVLTVAIGIIGLLLWKDDLTAVAILASIIAGGAANLGYTIIRFMDDTYGTAKDRHTRASLTNLSVSIDRLQHCAIMTEDPNIRCVFDKQLGQAFDAIIGQHPTAKLDIEVIGFTLYRFYTDQFEKLCQRGGVSLRAIIQDPTSATFKQIADQEGRKLESSITEAIGFTQAVLQKAEGSRNHKAKTTSSDAKFLTVGSKIRAGSSIELRWTSLAASITMMRVDDVIFVRPRFLLEGRDAPVFFEKYYRSQGRCFQAYGEYFQHAWDQSHCPSRAMVTATNQVTKITP